MEARMSLGKTIADARKKANLTQENLAVQIKRENGRSISASYLRDLEHDRIQAPSEFLIEQLAIRDYRDL
jgi:transcriptional regulator with XRE-family HTH domain